ncbi:amidase [Paenibacillus glycanilyticus]|uniref:amidase n=1 Tax=Paenibacillus glycanilyticus TaxID=126569 RepID=UPI00203F480B|nr:amidase [Paenibacillus glycanilyticus]MCM3631119.1 amidase [Paenibacillus glycanilyticus]
MSAFTFKEATVTSFHEALRNKTVTGSQLAEFYLDRIEAYNNQGPRIQAIVTVNPRALEEARELDAYFNETGELKGPLHGVPVLVKDQAETAGIVTTFGSKAFEAYVPEQDATIIKQLREAGAVILAKTSMCDFAAGWFSFSSVTDHTKNPYDLDRESGGSSAGTSAGIAANFGLIGVGEDTGGSIRLPSSFNNLFGLRPTTGLISRNGFSPLVHFQDTPGPITRSVNDAAKLMDVLVGFDKNDAFTSATSYTSDAGSYEASLEGAAMQQYRIGVLSDAFGPDTDPDCAPVNEQVRAAVEWLKASGVEVVEGLSIPDMAQWTEDTSLYITQSKNDINRFLSKRPNAPVKSFKEIYEGQLFHPMNDLFHDINGGPEVPERDASYYRKRVRQEEFRRTILHLMMENGVDFLIYPTVRVLPPTREELYAQKWTCLTFPTNTVIASQSGLPSMSVPAGFAAHLPVGFELVGKPYAESDLLRFAHAYEQQASPRREPAL